MCATIKRLESGGKVYVDPALTIEDTAKKEILENWCPYMIERKVGYAQEIIEIINVNDMNCPQEIIDYEMLEWQKNDE